MGNLVCVVLLIWYIYIKTNATQKGYVNLYLLALALCFIFWIMLTVHFMKIGKLVTLRTAVMANANCITDADWATVFTSMGTATNLDKVKTMMALFMVLFLLAFLGGVCVLCHVMKKLAACELPRYRDSRGGSPVRSYI